METLLFILVLSLLLPALLILFFVLKKYSERKFVHILRSSLVIAQYIIAVLFVYIAITKPLFANCSFTWLQNNISGCDYGVNKLLIVGWIFNSIVWGILFTTQGKSLLAYRKKYIPQFIVSVLMLLAILFIYKFLTYSTGYGTGG